MPSAPQICHSCCPRTLFEPSATNGSTSSSTANTFLPSFVWAVITRLTVSHEPSDIEQLLSRWSVLPSRNSGSARRAFRPEGDHCDAARNGAFSPGVRNAVLDEHVALAQCDLAAAVEQHAHFALHDDDQVDAIGVVHDAVVDVAELVAHLTRVGAAEHRPQSRPLTPGREGAPALGGELADLDAVAACRGKEGVCVVAAGLVGKLWDPVGAPDLPQLLAVIRVRPGRNDRQNLFVDRKDAPAVPLRRDDPPNSLPFAFSHREPPFAARSEEHTSELHSQFHLVC